MALFKPSITLGHPEIQHRRYKLTDFLIMADNVVMPQNRV